MPSIFTTSIHTQFATAFCSFCREVILLPWGFSFCCEVFLFAVRFFFSVCHEVILFAVRFFFLPWGYSFCREVFLFAARFFVLPWGSSFCRELFLFSVRFFCHEVILFAAIEVIFFCRRVFFLPWGYSFCREVFLFAVRLILLLWQLWATVLPTFEILFPKILDFSTCGYSGVRTSTNFAYLTSF